MSKTFIVAELSANHNGSKDVAIESVRAAKRAGADAIKLQTYTADTLTLKCDNPDFKISQGTLWDGKFLYDLYREAYTPWEWHSDLFDVAKQEGLICFSTPFDKSAVDLLETLNNPIYKIASFEITDVGLIEYAASKHKPMVLSIGIATEDDIALAVETCRKVGNNDITLLSCISSYPAPIAEANLATIPDLANRYGVKSGLSDHSMGSLVPIVGVSLGAVMLEKHFILDRNIGGPDSAFSMDEKEFTQMVIDIRNAEAAIGKVDYSMTEKKKNNRAFSRSLYVAEDVKQGDVVTSENVRSVRPGFGLHPRFLPDLIGKKFNSDYKKGTRMNFDMIGR